MYIELNNRIEFVIIAIIMLSVIAFFLRTKYVAVSRSNRLFYNFVLFALFSSLADLLTNIAEPLAGEGLISIKLALFIRVIFSCLSSFLIYWIFLYVDSFNSYDEGNRIGHTKGVILMLALVNAAMNIFNYFVPFLYTIDSEGKVKDSNVGFLRELIPLIATVAMIHHLIRRRKYFDKLKMGYIIVILALFFIGVLAEIISAMISPEGEAYLLAYMFVAVGASISMFGLESPDMVQLNESMAELEKSRAEAEAAKIEAEKANNLKTEFLARMSHEIRTPVNGVLGMNEMILRESNEPEIDNYAMDIKSAAENLISVIDDVLDFSKIESGDMEINEAEYKLGPCIKNLWNLFELRAKEKNLELVFDIDGEMPSVLFGDEPKIHQVVINLLSNAVKYTDKGSITLKIHGLGVSKGMASIEFSVTDTGKGIKDEDIAGLTEAYIRTELQSNRNIEGTGLGLAIVAKVLKLLDSELVVYSNYGKGSSFGFVVKQKIVDASPIGDFRKHERKETAPESKSAGQSKVTYPEGTSVLVVDDNLINLKVFSGILGDTGIHITEATGGSQCLELCAKNRYDLIFMDHLMPEPDGVETFKKLREDKDGLNAGTPVICLTANAIRGAREEYLAMGFEDAIFKPVSSAVLHEAVASRLGVNRGNLNGAENDH